MRSRINPSGSLEKTRWAVCQRNPEYSDPRPLLRFLSGLKPNSYPIGVPVKTSPEAMSSPEPGRRGNAESGGDPLRFLIPHAGCIGRGICTNAGPSAPGFRYNPARWHQSRSVYSVRCAPKCVVCSCIPKPMPSFRPAPHPAPIRHCRVCLLFVDFTDDFTSRFYEEMFRVIFVQR